MLETSKEKSGSAATCRVMYDTLCHKFVTRKGLAEEICCQVSPVSQEVKAASYGSVSCIYLVVLFLLIMTVIGQLLSKWLGSST